MGFIPKGIIYLDPRTKMFLLIATSLLVFLNNNYTVQSLVLTFLCVLSFLLGAYKTAIKSISLYLIFSAIKYLIFPLLPKVIALNFNIVVVTFIKLLPCFLAAKILVKTSSIRTLMYSLEKMHIPKSLVIPLTISVRYFPALKEEWNNISNVMKIRRIKGFRKIEFMYVPLMISASNTADELSQAITARGIENPCKKTCAVKLQFSLLDIMIFLICIVMIVYAVFKFKG